METAGGSQLFETAEKGEVMKNWPLKGGGSCRCSPTKEKKSSLFCKKILGEMGESSDQLSSKMYVYGITENRLEINFELS